MTRADEAGEFEGWLDRELRGAVAAQLRGAAPPARPAYAAARARRRRVAGLSARGAAVLVGLGLALAGGGVAMATGSPNPVTWGHQVVIGTLGGPPDGAAPAAQPRPVPAAPLGAPAAPAPMSSARPDPEGHEPKGQNQGDQQGAGQEQAQGATPSPKAASRGSGHSAAPGHQKDS
jgi:hypothetical protein